MMYGYQEIKNAVIINGKLYKAVIADNFDCHGCDIPRRGRGCCRICMKFENDSNVIFKRIVGNLLLKLQEDEEG